MDRDLHRSTELPSSESPHERLDQHGLRSRLDRLARSTRGRIGAALLALTGAGATAREADAATIMMQGEIVPRADVTEQPEYALALTNDEYFYDIALADGTADATMTWFSVENLADNKLERYVEMGSDVPNTVVAPDLLNDDNKSPFLLAIAELQEQQALRYALDPDGPGNDNIGLHQFLQGARVRAGFAPLTGSPTNPDEAVAMTNGPVMEGIYSGSVAGLDDAWIFQSVPEHTPEPSTLGLAVAGIAGAGLASRRRMKNVLKR